MMSLFAVLNNFIKNLMTTKSNNVVTTSIHRNITTSVSEIFRPNNRLILIESSKSCNNLIVFVTSEPPQCRTNVSLPNNAIDVSDFLEITCSVSHIGSWIPVFVCAPGLPGSNFANGTSSTRVSYRRVIAASDIADFAVLNCTVTFTPADTHDSSSVFAIPPDADVPDFEFIWSTSAIRVVNSTGNGFT